MKRAWRIIQVFIFTLVIVSSAHAELQGRMETSPGSGVYEAYYDTELEITWTTNAHLSGQSWTFDDANSWAAGLMFHGEPGRVNRGERAARRSQMMRVVFGSHREEWRENGSRGYGWMWAASSGAVDSHPQVFGIVGGGCVMRVALRWRPIRRSTPGV